MYQGVIPVTVYLNSCNVIVGYDYFSPNRRTRVITTFFNTRVGTAVVTKQLQKTRSLKMKMAGRRLSPERAFESHHVL